MYMHEIESVEEYEVDDDKRRSLKHGGKGKD